LSGVRRFGLCNNDFTISISSLFAAQSDVVFAHQPFSGKSQPMNPKLMTLKEFAQHIGVSYSTVRRMVANKRVRIVVPHRRAMIPASEAAKYSCSAKKGSSPSVNDSAEESGTSYSFPADLNC
jgi:excisionase family DNA binding protein